MPLFSEVNTQHGPPTNLIKISKNLLHSSSLKAHNAIFITIRRLCNLFRLFPFKFLLFCLQKQV